MDGVRDVGGERKEKERKEGRKWKQRKLVFKNVV